jgi:hypothetical protein
MIRTSATLVSSRAAMKLIVATAQQIATASPGRLSSRILATIREPVE